MQIRMVQKKNSVATVENSMEAFQKPKAELPYDPEISLLVIYPKNPKPLNWNGTFTPVIKTALFMIAKIYKKPKDPSTGECIKNN